MNGRVSLAQLIADAKAAGLVVTSGEEPEDADRFSPQPVDWSRLRVEGVPEADYLDAPHKYVPAGAKIWAWGPAESGKSIWAFWNAVRLTRRGLKVLYISEENPLPVEFHRHEGLRPDDEFLTFHHRQGYDLTKPDHLAAVIEPGAGCALIVLDTFTSVWTGDENSNAELAEFDRTLTQIVEATGASVLVLDHTGHPQMFQNRRGASAGRGASSKGQKADVTLTFAPVGDRGFTIDHGKNRFGMKELRKAFEVIDTDDGLDIISVADAERDELKARALELMDMHPDEFSKTGLAVVLKGRKEEALAAVQDLIDAGTIGRSGERGRLHRIEP